MNTLFRILVRASVAVLAIALCVPVYAKGGDQVDYRTLIQVASEARAEYGEEHWSAVTALNEEIAASGVNQELYRVALEMLSSDESSGPVKGMCLWILARSGTDEAFQLVSRFVQDGSLTALEVLSLFGERSLPLFEDLLHKHQPGTMEWKFGVAGLGGGNAEQGVPILLDYLSGQLSGTTPQDGLSDIARTLAYANDVRALPAVLEFCDHPDVEVRHAAYDGLLQVPISKHPECPPRAHQMDNYEWVREIERVARKGLLDPSEVIRGHSIDILGRIAYVQEDWSALELFTRELDSDSPVVREHAADALDQLRVLREIRIREQEGKALSSVSASKPNWWYEWRAEQEAQRSPRQKTTE